MKTNFLSVVAAAGIGLLCMAETADAGRRRCNKPRHFGAATAAYGYGYGIQTYAAGPMGAGLYTVPTGTPFLQPMSVPYGVYSGLPSTIGPQTAQFDPNGFTCAGADSQSLIGGMLIRTLLDRFFRDLDRRGDFGRQPDPDRPEEGTDKELADRVADIEKFLKDKHGYKPTSGENSAGTGTGESDLDQWKPAIAKIQSAADSTQIDLNKLKKQVDGQAEILRDIQATLERIEKQPRNPPAQFNPAAPVD